MNKKMNDKKEEDLLKKNEICTLSGLSDVMIQIYILTKEGNLSEKIEHAVFPSGDRIKSMGPQTLEKMYNILAQHKEENRRKKTQNKNLSLNTKETFAKKECIKQQQQQQDEDTDEYDNGGGEEMLILPTQVKTRKKTTKTFRPDEVRKFIIEKREKEIMLMTEKEIDVKIDEIYNFTNSLSQTRSTDQNEKEKGGGDDDDDDDDSFLLKHRPWNYNDKIALHKMDSDFIHNNENSLKLNTNALKRDCILMFDYIGWGLTKDGFYVFVYYIGPDDKGVNYCELKKQSNWKMVPKGHLIHFHKHVNSYYKHFLNNNNTSYACEQSKYIANQITHDLRFFVHKWQQNTTVSKEHEERIMANKALFLSPLHNNEYYIQVIKEQRRQQDEKDSQKRTSSPKKMIIEEKPSTQILRKDLPLSKSKSSDDVKNQHHHVDKDDEKKKKNEKDNNDRLEALLIPLKERMGGDRIPDRDIGGVPTETHKRYVGVNINNYTDLSKFPIDKSNQFSVDSFSHLVHRTEESIHNDPSFYEWEPIELVKAFAIASNIDLHAKTQISKITENYNISFDNQDSSHIAMNIFTNPDVQYDIKRATYEYVLANMTMDLVSRDKTPFPVNQQRNPIELLK
jgi:hypothetical protein